MERYTDRHHSDITDCPSFGVADPARPLITISWVQDDNEGLSVKKREFGIPMKLVGLIEDSRKCIAHTINICPKHLLRII
jgi:hypothetical protein